MRSAGRRWSSSRWVLGVMALAAVALALTWLPVPQVVRYGAAFMLLWILPTVSWAYALEGPLLERLAGGLGMAFVGSGLTTLILHLIPGAFPTHVARLLDLLLTVLPFALVMRRSMPSPPLPARRWRLGIVAVLVVAALVRLPNLGYSEFQGDEAVIMTRAAQALAGDDGELFLHAKGPAEILIPMSLWSLTGTISEWQVRLPFALAGLLAVLVVALLASRWFDGRAGIIAGALVAINGFLVAFSRIVQYQNIVVAMGGLALLWLLRYRTAPRRPTLMMAAAFMAYGLLAHYDAVLAVPAALWILVTAVRRVVVRGQMRTTLVARGREILWAVIVGAVILSLFYVPFVRDPMFSRTYRYLTGGRLGGGSFFHNSLIPVWRMSVFYNSIYYIAVLVAFVLAAAVMRLGGVAAWLYVLVPFLFYAFVVVDPRTHVYTFYPGIAILVGGAMSAIWRRWLAPARRRWAVAAGGVLGLGYVLSAGYVGYAFVQHQIEYKRAWPESRHPLYPVPYSDDALPPFGHFGFPYRAGWKAVERLFADGVLDGIYATNEEPEITDWYVRSGIRTLCGNPDYYMIAKDVQDELPIDRDALARDYTPVIEILVGDMPKITVYARATDGGSTTALASRKAAKAAAAFDAETDFRAYVPQPNLGETSVGAAFGDIARLTGYDLSQRELRPGDQLQIILYWQALSSPGRNYQVFTHLMFDGEVVAQHDGAPACNFAPAALWEEGDVIRDEHIVEIGEDAPLGTWALWVGMYDLITHERLRINDGQPDSLFLTDVEVMPISPE